MIQSFCRHNSYQAFHAIKKTHYSSLINTNHYRLFSCSQTFISKKLYSQIFSEHECFYRNIIRFTSLSTIFGTLAGLVYFSNRFIASAESSSDNEGHGTLKFDKNIKHNRVFNTQCNQGRSIIPDDTYSYVIIGSGTAAYTALETIRLTARAGQSILLISEQDRMFTLDVATEHRPLDERFQDIYNQWRRHIAYKHRFEEEWPSANHHNNDSATDNQQNRTEDVIDLENHENEHVNLRKSLSVSLAERKEESEVKKEVEVSVLIDHINDMEIDPEDKKIVLSDSSVIGYEKCLLACPGKPRELYVLQSSISYLLKDKINTLRNLDDFEELERTAKIGGQKILVIGGHGGSHL